MKLRAFVALLMAVGASGAVAQTPPHPLAGSWIAVDDGFPRLVAAGLSSRPRRFCTCRPTAAPKAAL